MIGNIKPSMFSGTLDRSSKADGKCADIKQDKELQHIPIYNIDRKERSPIIKEDEAFQCPLKCTSRTRWSDADVLASHLATYHNFKLEMANKLASSQFAADYLHSLFIFDVPCCFICGIKPHIPSKFRDHITNIHNLILCYQCPF